MEWSDRASIKKPQWLQFESRMYIGSDISDEVRFLAHFRPAANVVKGAAIIEVPMALYLSLLWQEHRVVALDSCSGQRHVNKKGHGLPYFGQLVKAKTHLHIWTDAGEGYVEPIVCKSEEVEELFKEFSRQVNLWLNGRFAHPLENKQLDLLI